MTLRPNKMTKSKAIRVEHPTSRHGAVHGSIYNITSEDIIYQNISLNINKLIIKYALSCSYLQGARLDQIKILKTTRVIT